MLRARAHGANGERGGNGKINTGITEATAVTVIAMSVAVDSRLSARARIGDHRRGDPVSTVIPAISVLTFSVPSVLLRLPESALRLKDGSHAPL